MSNQMKGEKRTKAVVPAKRAQKEMTLAKRESHAAFQAEHSARMKRKSTKVIAGLRGVDKGDLRAIAQLASSIINPIDDVSPTSTLACPAFEGQPTATYRSDLSVAELPLVPTFFNYVGSATQKCSVVLGLNRTMRRVAYATSQPAPYPSFRGSSILELKGGTVFQNTANPDLLPYTVATAGTPTVFSGFFDSPVSTGATFLGCMPSANGAWYPVTLGAMADNATLSVIVSMPEATSLWAVRYVRVLTGGTLAYSQWGAVNPITGSAICKTGFTNTTAGILTDKGFMLEFCSASPFASQVTADVTVLKTDLDLDLIASTLWVAYSSPANFVVEGTALAKDIASFDREAIISAAELITNVTPLLDRGGVCYCIRLPSRTQLGDFYRAFTTIDQAIVKSIGLMKYKGGLDIGLNCFHIGNGNERDVVAGQIDKVDMRLYYCIHPVKPQSLTLRARDCIAYTSSDPIVSLAPSVHVSSYLVLYEALSRINPCGSNEGHMDKVRDIANSIGKWLTSDTAHDLYSKGYDAISKGLKVWLESKFSDAKSAANPQLGDRVKAGQRIVEVFE